MPVELDLVEQTGLSSIDQERKNLLRLQSRHSVRSISVMTRTLNEVLNWAQLPWIDFLKIDVEGHELSVLKGLDLSRFRPKVLVVETTDPLIHEGGRVAMDKRPRLAADFKAIQTAIESSGYVNLFFDGLNTWWADQHLDAETIHRFRNAFSTPVNVFDTISPMEQRRVERMLGRRIDRLARARQGDVQALHRQYQITANLKGDMARQQDEIENLSLELQDALLQLNQLRESSSWKLTKPYRQLGEQLRKLRGSSSSLRR